MERGDVYLVDLDPTKGNEQAGKRFVLVVSRKYFNNLGVALVCPITQGGNFARHKGFAVSVTGIGAQTQGVVLCNQLRVMDLKARSAKRIEALPPVIVDEVLSKLQTLLD